MIHLDPANLSTAQARAHLAVELAQLERAECASALSKGATRRRYVSYIHRHRANVIALADIAEGPLPADIAGLSDDELLAALTR